MRAHVAAVALPQIERFCLSPVLERQIGPKLRLTTILSRVGRPPAALIVHQHSCEPFEWRISSCSPSTRCSRSRLLDRRTCRKSSRKSCHPTQNDTTMTSLSTGIAHTVLYCVVQLNSAFPLTGAAVMQACQLDDRSSTATTQANAYSVRGASSCGSRSCLLPLVPCSS